MRKKMFDELQLTLFGAPETQPAQVEEKPVRMTMKQLKDELEREQMRLAVIGVAAHGGSVEGIQPEYSSDSLRAVLRLVQARGDWQTLHQRCQLAEAEVARLHSALTSQYDAIVATVQQVDTTVPLDVHEMRDEILAAIAQHDPRKGRAPL